MKVEYVRQIMVVPTNWAHALNDAYRSQNEGKILVAENAKQAQVALGKLPKGEIKAKLAVALLNGDCSLKTANDFVNLGIMRVASQAYDVDGIVCFMGKYLAS